MLRRLLYYCFGICFGILITFFLFHDRKLDFAYLPNARTLKYLRNQKLLFSNTSLCQLNCMNKDTLEFKNFFTNDKLKINFNLSEYGDNKKVYQISSESYPDFLIQDSINCIKLIRIKIDYCE